MSEQHYTLRFKNLSVVTYNDNGTPGCDMKISAIKKYRVLNDSSLKTAKLEIEKALNGQTIYMKDNTDRRSFAGSIKEIRENFARFGFEMEGPFYNEIDDSIRQIIKNCIDDNQLDKAIKLIRVLQDTDSTVYDKLIGSMLDRT